MNVVLFIYYLFFCSDEKDDADTESTNCASSPTEVKSKSAGSSPSAAGKSPSRALSDRMMGGSGGNSHADTTGGKSPAGISAMEVDEKPMNLDCLKDEDVKVPPHALSSDRSNVCTVSS